MSHILRLVGLLELLRFFFSVREVSYRGVDYSTSSQNIPNPIVSTWLLPSTEADMKKFENACNLNTIIAGHTSLKTLSHRIQCLSADQSHVLKWRSTQDRKQNLWYLLDCYNSRDTIDVLGKCSSLLIVHPLEFSGHKQFINSTPLPCLTFWCPKSTNNAHLRSS